MRTNKRIAIAGATLVAAGVVGAGVAAAGVSSAGSGTDDDADDTPITSPDLERASAAALEHTGGGRVTGTEIEDEESYYEVEVKLENGSVVDVQLDRSFTVVGQDADSDVADS